jgi:hypothetical protein
MANPWPTNQQHAKRTKHTDKKNLTIDCSGNGYSKQENQLITRPRRRHPGGTQQTDRKIIMIEIFTITMLVLLVVCMVSDLNL